MGVGKKFFLKWMPGGSLLPASEETVKNRQAFLYIRTENRFFNICGEQYGRFRQQK